MRVATYSEASAPTRGSLFALCVLVVTILMGTGVVPTIILFVSEPIANAMTPIWLLMYLSAFLGLMFTQGINWISWLVRYRILLVLLMLGTIVSVSWSIDSQVSAERVVHLLGSTFIAIYIGFSVPLLTTLRVFSIVLGVFIVASVAVAVAIPALGIQSYEGAQVWRGVFNSKNDLGFWAAVGVLLYITLSDSLHVAYLKVLCFLLAAICLVVLVLSQSATSLLAMLVAGALSSYLYIANRFQLGFIRMVVVASLFVAVIALIMGNIETAELVGRSGDLTGRGEVWRQTWKLIQEQPLTGVGYGALWYPNDATIWIQQSLTDFTWIVHHAHNGLLQVASEVGIPLALIALLMVAQQLIEIFYCQYERQQAGVLFVLAFAVAYLISNYSEARFLIHRELFWIFFLALPISMLRQINLVGSLNTEEETDTNHLTEPKIDTVGDVQGKPWLNAARQQQAALPSSGLAVEAAPPVAYLEHVAPESGQVLDDDIDFDLLTSTLSITAADIDLGENDFVQLSRQLDDGEDELSDEAPDLEDKSEELASEASRSANTDDSFVQDDTYDVDRYDINLDETGEWLDVPLDDK